MGEMTDTFKALKKSLDKPVICWCLRLGAFLAFGKVCFCCFWLQVRFYYHKWLSRVNSLRYLESPGGKQRLKNTQIVRKIANNLIQRVRLKGRPGRRASELGAPPR